MTFTAMGLEEAAGFEDPIGKIERGEQVIAESV